MQKFIRFIADNAHFTLLLMGLIVFYGVFSIGNMKVSQEPEVNSPSIVIELHLPGASADEMQKNVVFPIESELQQIDALSLIRTTISGQFTVMYIKFDAGTDMDIKMREVETAINQIKRHLPQNLVYFIKKLALSKLQSAFLLALDTPQGDNKPVAQALIKHLREIPALSSIDLVEGKDNVVVALDAERLHTLGISYQQVQQALLSHNRFSFQSRLQTVEQSLQFTGLRSQFNALEDIAAKTVLYSAAGNPLTLDQVATVAQQPQGQATVIRYQREPVRLLKIGVKEDANVLLVQRALDRSIQEFKAKQALPLDDSSFVWSKVGAGITYDPEAEIEKLFKRFAELYSYLLM